MQGPIAIIASVALFLALGSRERLEIRDSFEFEPAAQTGSQNTLAQKVDPGNVFDLFALSWCKHQS